MYDIRMSTTLRSVGFVFCGIALVISVSAGAWGSASVAAILITILVVSLGRNNAPNLERDDRKAHVSTQEIIDQIFGVSFKWVILSLALATFVIALSVWEYGGIDAGSVVLGVLAVTYVMLVVAYRLWHRLRAQGESSRNE